MSRGEEWGILPLTHQKTKKYLLPHPLYPSLQPLPQEKCPTV